MTTKTLGMPQYPHRSVVVGLQSAVTDLAQQRVGSVLGVALAGVGAIRPSAVSVIAAVTLGAANEAAKAHWKRHPQPWAMVSMSNRVVMYDGGTTFDLFRTIELRCVRATREYAGRAAWAAGSADPTTAIVTGGDFETCKIGRDGEFVQLTYSNAKAVRPGTRMTATFFTTLHEAEPITDPFNTYLPTTFNPASRSRVNLELLWDSSIRMNGPVGCEYNSPAERVDPTVAARRDIRCADMERLDDGWATGVRWVIRNASAGYFVLEATMADHALARSTA